MLTKRIIPCLDIRNGRTVKGVNFIGLKDAGDPVELAARYALEGADELVLLDISASQEGRSTMIELVEKVARVVNIPFTVGGGINSVQDAHKLLMAGADKISVNSSALRNPGLIEELALRFGSQCVVLAVDGREANGHWEVFSLGGTRPTGRDLFDWVSEGVDLGAGEILFTAMNKDGTKEGFAIDALKQMTDTFNVPVIASGGAGNIDDFIDVFMNGNVDAALAASVFHYGEIEIPNLKTQLRIKNILVR